MRELGSDGTHLTAEFVEFALRTDPEWHRELAEHSLPDHQPLEAPPRRRPRTFNQNMRSLGITAVVIVLFGPLIGLALLAIIKWHEYVMLAIVILFLLPLAAPLMVKWLRTHHIKRRLSRAGAPIDAQWRLGHDGLQVVSPEIHPPYAWSDVESAQVCDHGILVRFKTRRVVWLPEHALKRGTMETVRTLARHYAPHVAERQH